MMGRFLNSTFSLMITIVCLGSLLTSLIWYKFYTCNVGPYRLPAQKKYVPKPSDLCKGCKEVIDKVKERYSQTWKKQENYHKLRLQLNINCNGSKNAIITQDNTPLGSVIAYDGNKMMSIEVTPEIFKLFTKFFEFVVLDTNVPYSRADLCHENPFSKKNWDTCSVVGNGGILANSSCGKMIDSADFVIRCNLPPLENGYENDVGMKTDLVTANPSILSEKYGSLIGRRREFVDSLWQYGNSLLLLPAFSFRHRTPACLRAVYSIEDFESSVRPVFFNPQYLESLAHFWRSHGLRTVRLSTGLMMASLALELCENVHLYGFWPFSNHPYDLNALTNHYYDDKRGKASYHAMPVEFDVLLQLHSQGVLKLHLGDCPSDEK